ncbi:hypothetical protein EST38_g3946 [Candolleomyces aberdarensis]|uniref:Phospholipid/glycerol acyltransferase domain-containing protein n=1 Tax=Candolleomyces aberdarensis TaxID=2316362 RepID=A0A4Q2DP42_9AGAR|nr:hypothetical protein EST38_g3946 [Candolleomyces aberdarensis]
MPKPQQLGGGRTACGDQRAQEEAGLHTWLIQAAGTVPIQRRKDNADGTADNTVVLQNLMEALEAGDAVCLFPEGISRFHPEVAPLKTGVARMVSDVLGRNRDDPDFEVSLLPCSVTYMHRQHFRSDVLVSFDEPMVFSVKNNPELIPPVDFTHIRQVTDGLQERIRSGVLEAPTWEIIRGAKLAAKMYAPLGTLMPLGEYVRLSRRFSDAFTGSMKAAPSNADQEPVLKLCKDLNVGFYSLALHMVPGD